MTTSPLAATTSVPRLRIPAGTIVLEEVALDLMQDLESRSKGFGDVVSSLSDPVNEKICKA